MQIIKFEPKYRDDLIFMILEAKNALGRMPGLNEDLLDIQANYFDKGDLFWIAIDDNDRVIGSVGYSSIENSDEVVLHRLFVKYNMKHQGIGTVLLKTAEEHLKQAGKKAIIVHLGNKEHFFESCQFYPKNGYVEYSPNYMRKELKQAELWDIYDFNRNKTGRTVERGKPMSQNEYHLVVNVWIQNSKSEWLISKRSPNKHYGNLWEVCGGSAVAGEDSITAALREAKEELGVELNHRNGQIFTSAVRQYRTFPDHLDVWVFRHDCDIEDVILQESETCDAMWATSKKIIEMEKNGEFIPMEVFPYMNDLFEKVDSETKVSFCHLNKSEFSTISHDIFNILADNMEIIAPTANTREEDYKCWHEGVSDGLKRDERQIVLIKDEDNIIGFFQYYTNADTFMMEEIQFKPEYQGKNIFRALYGFLIPNIRKDIKYVEAYANITNPKSMGILGKLGLTKIGINKNGRSFHFKGKYSDLLKWYKSK